MAVPKLRFKDENGADYPEWEKKYFKNILRFLSNNSFSRDMLNYDNGNVKNIHYGDVLILFGNITDVSNDDVPYINTDIELNKINEENYLRSSDIIIADAAEDYTVGKGTEIINLKGIKALSGLHTIACRPKIEFALGYLGFFINSDRYHNQIRRLAQGTKVYSINKGFLNDIIIEIPYIEEQKKIASFLSTYDKKIEAEKKILADLQEMKKGLLQQMFV